MIDLDIVKRCGNALLAEGLCDGIGHELRGVPHAVKDHDGAVLHHALAPTLIAVEDFLDMGAPDDAVPRGNQLDGEGGKRLECGLGLLAEGHEDVGIVFLSFEQDGREVVLVIETVRGGQMLAKGVVGEEDFFFGAIGDHTVRPVKHGRRHEGKGTASDGECVACLDCLIAEAAVARREALETVGLAGDDGCLRAVVCHERNSAGVVRLHVAGNDVVDLRWIDDGRNTLQKLFPEGFLDGIDERDFFIQNQIGVVGRPTAGLISVEAAHGPVDCPHPINIFFDFDCLHRKTSIVEYVSSPSF